MLLFVSFFSLSINFSDFFWNFRCFVLFSSFRMSMLNDICFKIVWNLRITFFRMNFFISSCRLELFLFFSRLRQSFVCSLRLWMLNIVIFLRENFVLAIFAVARILRRSLQLASWRMSLSVASYLHADFTSLLCYEFFFFSSINSKFNSNQSYLRITILLFEDKKKDFFEVLSVFSNVCLLARFNAKMRACWNHSIYNHHCFFILALFFTCS